ncbi:hypothetical protein BHM03_00052676 [Ensete ventricosum]|nr:hypothetical protein BHM03_00052676 [Ensete ventricosum]
MRELVRKLSSNSFASESKEEIGNDLSQLYHIRASSGGTCIVCREWLVDRATGAFRFFDVTSGLQGDMGLTTEVFRVWIAQRVFLRRQVARVIAKCLDEISLASRVGGSDLLSFEVRDDRPARRPGRDEGAQDNPSDDQVRASR